MGLFDKLFKVQKKTDFEELKNNANLPEKCLELLRLKQFLEDMLNCDKYIAKSEYLSIIPLYSKTIEYFNVLIDSQSIASYCKDKNIPSWVILDICNDYANIDKLVKNIMKITYRKC